MSLTRKILNNLALCALPVFAAPSVYATTYVQPELNKDLCAEAYRLPPGSTSWTKVEADGNGNYTIHAREGERIWCAHPRHTNMTWLNLTVKWWDDVGGWIHGAELWRTTPGIGCNPNNPHEGNLCKVIQVITAENNIFKMEDVTVSAKDAYGYYQPTYLQGRLWWFMGGASYAKIRIDFQKNGPNSAPVKMDSTVVKSPF